MLCNFAAYVGNLTEAVRKRGKENFEVQSILEVSQFLIAKRQHSTGEFCLHLQEGTFEE
jgi:hypothetical protein